jgi:hypothetical protein
MAEQGGDQSVHRRPGDLIRLVLGTTIIRDGREMTVKATLAERRVAPVMNAPICAI